MSSFAPKKTTSSSRHQDAFPLDPSIEAGLKETFRNFCGSTGEMNNKNFVKLMKDSNIIGRRFSVTDADLIYSKCKSRTSAGTGITYSTFRNGCLPEVGVKSGFDLIEICLHLAQTGGPVFNSTTAESVALYDDKSTFTGTHARGGPAFEVNQGLYGHLDRSDANVRGVKVSNTHNSQTPIPIPPPTTPTRVPQSPYSDYSMDPHAQMYSSPLPPTPPMPQTSPTPSRQIPQPSPTTQQSAHSPVPTSTKANPSPQPIDENALYDTFLRFAPTGEIDSRTFIKLLKDNLVFSTRFPSGEADIIFTKYKAKQQPRCTNPNCISYQTFRSQALPEVATKRGVDISVLANRLAGSSGPTLHATVPDAVSFHDDVNTFTGTHARGGPGFEVDHDPLKNLLDRSEANVRGVKVSHQQRSDKPSGFVPMAGHVVSSQPTTPLQSREQRPFQPSSPPPNQTYPPEAQVYPPQYFPPTQEYYPSPQPTNYPSYPQEYTPNTPTPIRQPLSSTSPMKTSSVPPPSHSPAPSPSPTMRSLPGPAPVLYEPPPSGYVSPKSSHYNSAMNSTKSGGGSGKKTPVGTVPQYNRFHDDPSTYTGVHARGGPTFEVHQGLYGHLDRSDADVRGVRR